MNKKFTEIDFTPLKQRHRRALKSVLRHPLLKVAVFGVIVYGIIDYVSTRRNGGSFTLVVYALQSMVGVSIASLYLYYGQVQKSWEHFAAINGWQLIKNEEANEYVPRSVGSYGTVTSRKTRVIRSIIENIPWDLQLHQYTVKSGRSRVIKYFTVMSTTLSKAMPYIALDAKHNNGGIELLPTGAHKVELEGDFSRYFDLWIEDNSHIDVLTIITPDVMQTLIDNNRMHDIEIDGNRIYFVRSGHLLDPEPLVFDIESAMLLLAQLNHKVKTLRYDVTQNKNYVTEASGRVQNTAHRISTFRLSKNWLLVIIIFVILVIISTLMPLITTYFFIKGN